MTMDYRAWIEVPGLPYSSEAEHERLFRALLERHLDLGPVMGWTDDGDATRVVLSAPGPNQDAAAEKMVAAVADSLRACGLGQLTPSAAFIEPVAEDAAAASA